MPATSWSVPAREPWISPLTRFAQRWHARIGRGLLRVVLGVVAALALVAAVHRFVELRRGRRALVVAVEAERATTAEVARLDAAHALVPALARGEVAADGAAAGFDGAALRALLGRPGLYLHAVADEVGSPRAVHAASIVSRKDSFLACLARPPVDATPAAVRAAAVRYRFGVHLDALLPQVADVGVVEDGLRVASAAWLGEATAVDDLVALRLLRHERAARTEPLRARAVAAARAEWLAVVLIELPEELPTLRGAPALAAAVRGSRLDELARRPHVARVALFDLARRTALVSLRVPLDATAVKVPNPRADADDLQGCQAAVAVHHAVQGSP